MEADLLARSTDQPVGVGHHRARDSTGFRVIGKYVVDDAFRLRSRSMVAVQRTGVDDQRLPQRPPPPTGPRRQGEQLRCGNRDERGQVFRAR